MKMDKSELDKIERRLGKNAIITATRRYYCVWTESGFRLLWGDPDCEPIILDSSVSDAAIGDAIQSALSKSRFLSTAEAESFATVRQQEISDKSAECDAALAKRFGYKNETQMNKEAKYVSVKFSEGKFTIKPYHTNNSTSYSGVDADQHVIIPGNSSPTKIGAAFRQALSRCTSAYDK